MERDAEETHTRDGPAHSPTLRPDTDGVPIAEARTVGRFMVLERIGAGGMGAVYAAYDPQLDRKVAVKLIHHLPSDQDETLRLLREAQALARLAHPNVVAVYEAGLDGGRVYVAMEYVPGATLKGWLAAHPPGGQSRFDRALDIIVQAGRGLAAAHASGLVHRDFKPANVLVGDDGRVRVVDFGLARMLGEHGATAPGVHSLSPPDDTPAVAVGDKLTKTGAVVGTPAYMAPEQFGGAALDARTDQFGFCVAAWELLFGRRPFEGRTFVALSTAIRETTAQPPAETDVPDWVLPILRKGMAKAARGRYADMDALLRAIEAHARPRRGGVAGRGWMLGGIALVGAAAVYAFASSGEPPCQGSEQRLAGVWDPVQRERVGAGMLALPGGAQAWPPVQETLDAFAQEWVLAHRQTCEATAVQRVQSEEVLDKRMACLDGGLRELRGLVRALDRPSPQVLDRSAAAAAKLPRLARCADLEYVQAEVPLPEDPAQQAVVEGIMQRLADARALSRTGSAEPALELATSALDEAKATQYGPVLAQGHLAVAEAMRIGSAPLDETIIHYQAAFYRAYGSGDDRVAAAASRLVAANLARRFARVDQAQRWLDIAEAAAQRRGTEQALISIAHARGNMLLTKGDYAEALEVLEDTLRRSEAFFGPEDLDLAEAYTSVGIVLIQLDRKKEAIAMFDRAVSVFSAVLGPGHPRTLLAMVNQANAAVETGERDEAARVFDSIEARVEASGARRPRIVASALAGRSSMLREQGEHEAALTASLAAAERFTEAGGGTPTSYTGVSLLYAAEDQRHLGRLEQARASATRALEILEGNVGPSHPFTAEGLSELGRIHLAAGRLEAAAEVLHRAASILEDSEEGGARRQCAKALLELSTRQREAGQAAQAVVSARAAKAVVPADATEQIAAADAALAAAGGSTSRSQPAGSTRPSPAPGR